MNPIDAVALYSFNADHPSELSIRAGQNVKIAPKEIQQLNRLLSTNWLLATVDGQNVGLVPVNYIKRQEANYVFNATQSQTDLSSNQVPINSQNDDINKTVAASNDTNNLNETNCPNLENTNQAENLV